MSKEIKYIDDLIKAKAELKKLKLKLENFDESVFLLSIITNPPDGADIMKIRIQATKFLVEKYLNIKVPTDKEGFNSKTKEMAKAIYDFQMKFIEKNLLNLTNL